MLKKIVAILLAVVMVMGVLPYNVFADSNDRGRAMVNYFKNNDITGMDSISDEEFRLFAIYISNFYTPFITSTSDLSSCVMDAVAKIKGYDSTDSMSENDKALAKQLGSGIIANMLNKSVPLKSDGEVVKLSQLFSQNDLTLKTDSGCIALDLSFRSDAWSVDSNSGIGGFDDALMALCIKDAATHGEDNNQWLDNVYGTYAENELYLSPFGDIIAKTSAGEGGEATTALVIVPGCLNYNAFKGSRVPIGNNFMLDILNTAEPASESEKDLKIDGKYNVRLVNTNEAKPFYSESSAVLTFARKLNVPQESVGQQKVTTEHITDATIDLWRNGGSSSDTTLTSSDSAVLTFGKSLVESIIGGSSYVHDLGDVDKAKGLDEDARRRIGNIFYTSIFDISNLDTRLTFFSLESEPMTVEFLEQTEEDKFDTLYNSNINNSINYKVVLNGIWDANTTIKLHIAYAYLTRSYSRDKIRDFILAIKAGNEDTKPWAEMFYTYMLTVDTENSVLPECDKSELTSLSGVLSEQGAESTADPDAALKQKSNTLMNRILALTSDSMNSAKGDLADNFINAWILSQHRKMVGVTDRNATTVSNDTLAYSGFTGHVTTPRLRDVEFTANLMENYRTVYFTLLAILLTFTIIMVILHMRTIMQAVATFTVMAFVLLLPQSAIDLTIQLANGANEQLYNNRFNYWAILQHQQSLAATGGAVSDTEDTDTDIDNAIANTTSKTTNYFEDTGVRLKWMAPKKHDDAAELLSKSNDELTVGTSTFKWLFGNYLSGESYAPDAMATYVYRTYTSLANEAQYMWENKVEGNSISGNWSTLTGYANNYPYLNNLDAFSGASSVDGNTIFTESADINGTYQNIEYKTKFTDTGRISSLYANSDELFTNALTGVLDTDPNDKENMIVPVKSGVTDKFGREDDLYCYALYSESPYYYFYNTFRAIQVEDSEADVGTDGGSATFLTTLLAESPYKVTDGELVGYYKDFLDLESLFTYIVPYLQASNEYVIQWTDLYGTDVDGLTIGETLKDKYEYLQETWNCYSPWVDSLYSEDIYSGKIRSGGKTRGVTNAFSPYAYEGEGLRPMVFGEADMYAQGVTYNDLSEVEKRIQKVLENTYEDIRYLANYANFSDEALCSAAAMIATFNFNSIFSQNNLVGKDITLYPQGYEMKNFSYDAFLRLILLNSTGQSPASTVDIYTSIIQNSGFWCGVFLLLTDLFAIYVLPTFKFVFVVCAFILSIVMCIGVYLQKLDQVPKVILKALVVPMLAFFGVSFGHALFTSFLMGEGLTDYVGSKNGAFVTNDPTATLIMLSFINCIACVILFIMLKRFIKTLIEWIGDTVTAATGVLSALGGAFAAKVSELANTGKITLKGSVSNGDRAAVGTGNKATVASGVGYRSTTGAKPVYTGGNTPMPAGLSRKLNTLGDKLSDMTSPKNVAKVGAKVVGTGAKVAAGAVGGAASALYYRSGLHDSVEAHKMERTIKQQDKLTAKAKRSFASQHNRYVKSLDKRTDKAIKGFESKFGDDAIVAGAFKGYMDASHKYNDELNVQVDENNPQAMSQHRFRLEQYKKAMTDNKAMLNTYATSRNEHTRAASKAYSAVQTYEANASYIERNKADIDRNMKQMQSTFKQSRDMHTLRDLDRLSQYNVNAAAPVAVVKGISGGVLGAFNKSTAVKKAVEQGYTQGAKVDALGNKYIRRGEMK